MRKMGAGKEKKKKNLVLGRLGRVCVGRNEATQAPAAVSLQQGSPLLGKWKQVVEKMRTLSTGAGVQGT